MLLSSRLSSILLLYGAYGLTHDRKVASSSPVRSGGRIFFSRVNFVSCLLFCVRSTPVLPHWHVKDPCHSAKGVCGRLHQNRRIPLTKWSRPGLTILMRSKYSVGNYQGNELTRTSSRNTQPQSSQFSCGLILT